MWYFVLVVAVLVVLIIITVGGLGSMACIGVAVRTLLKGGKPRANA